MKLFAKVSSAPAKPSPTQVGWMVRLRRIANSGELALRLAAALALGWACNQAIGLLFVSPGTATISSVSKFEMALNDRSGPSTIGTKTGVHVCLSLATPAKNRDPACSGLPSDQREFTFAILRPIKTGETASSDTGCPEIADFRVSCGAFFTYDKLQYLPVWTPAIEDSIHSFLRKLERAAYYEEGELKLCSGTRRTLSPEQCQTSQAIERNFEDRGLNNLLDYWVRFGAMLCGIVQLLTWAVFWYILLDVRGVINERLSPTATLYKIDKINGVDKLTQFKQNEFSLRYKEYCEQPIRSIGDELWVSYLPFQAASSGTIIPSDKEDIDRARERLRSKAEDTTASLERMAENILKLAFAGTIIGIGQSLFEARDLDTADPIAKILVKSEMFAGIGTAFGNTLVGIILSMIALLAIENMLSAWLASIDRQANLVRDFADSGQPLVINPIPPPPTAGGREDRDRRRPTRSRLETLGRLGAAAFVISIAVVHRDKIIPYVTLAWSEALNMMGGP